MDPLSAFGLAASTVQFITFATTLIHKSIDIYNSGSTDETRSLEDTYQTLSGFSHSLGSSGTVNNFEPGLRIQMQSLMSLSNSCRDDCEKMLRVVSKLKVDTGAGRKLLKTFKAAWATFIKDDEIASLEQRLNRSQATLTLCIGQLSNYYLSIHRDELSALKKEAKKYHSHQNEQLTKIQSTLDEFKRMLQAKTSTHDTNFSESDIEALRKRLSSLDILENDIARDHRLLDSLRFKRQPERHRLIPEAHRQTFSWILNPSRNDAEANKLRRWLEQPDKGIFWVSGKPGSGKSTLMKFVADHEETKKILSVWANRRKLIVASHYFWWSGTSLQKSQEGLLRTLLYSILQQCPSLIRIVCGEKWARVLDTTSLNQEESSGTGWAIEELHSAINVIANHPDLPVRFCFFIDGLDEYGGDHQDICNTFKDLVSVSSAIKICLSSRPWNIFEQAFGNESTRIHVHNLTRGDMRIFAQSRLSQHPQWQAISTEIPGVQGLVNEVIERAQGVFLWVFLVTGLLSEGLSNGDSLSDLNLRLDTFPSDLERFFKDVLERVDSFYHSKVSAVLQMALKAGEPLHILLYAFHEEEFENMDYAIDKQIGVLSDEAVEKRQLVMAKRLNGWSKGLVEVRNREVHFLHRTVVDFLKTREMEDFFAKHLPPWFCIGLSLLKAHLAWMKTSNFGDSFRTLPGANRTTLELRVQEATRWAFEIEATVPASSPVHDTVIALLDDMEHSIKTLYVASNPGFLNESETKWTQRFFRESVLRGHLAGYLSRKLQVSPEYFKVLAQPALSTLIDGPLGNDPRSSWPTGYINTLRCLLVNGQDPNEEYRVPEVSNQDYTPWKKFLSTVICWDELGKCAKPDESFVRTIHSGLLSLYLEHGADPGAMIFRTGNAFPVFSTAWVDMLLSSFEVSSKPSDEEAYLQELDAFLRKGVKIDAVSQSTIISDHVVRKGAPAYEAFFSQLVQRTKSGECNISLLERVTKILLRKMQDSRIELDWALEKVSTAIAPAKFQHLRSEFEARGKAVLAGNKKRKKKRAGKPPGGGSKRQKVSR